MSSPLVTKAEVIAYLRAVAKEQSLPVQVQDTYPSIDDNVAYGVYVNSNNALNRLPYKLGVQKCGSIYIVTDQMDIMFVSYQNDPQAPAILETIHTMISDAKFWNGYHEVAFRDAVTIGSRNQIYTYTIEPKRIDFNTNTK